MAELRTLLFVFLCGDLDISSSCGDRLFSLISSIACAPAMGG